MNYEAFYQESAGLMKDLKDSAGAVARLQKVVQKDIAHGDLADLKKVLAQLAEVSAQLSERTDAAGKYVEAFDTKAYFTNGEFTKELLAALDEQGVDVKGEQGVYEVFPYRVRIYGDTEHAEEVYINRKKIASFRPSYIAGTIKEGRDKLYKAKFNAESFMNELAEAYTTCCLKEGLRPGTSVALAKLYKILTPMARARKEYDMQAYAFDLARLYEAGTEAWTSRDGRIFTFGTSRDGKSGIRVLSSAGIESYITTIASLRTGDED